MGEFFFAFSMHDWVLVRGEGTYINIANSDSASHFVGVERKWVMEWWLEVALKRQVPCQLTVRGGVSLRQVNFLSI